MGADKSNHPAEEEESEAGSKAITLTRSVYDVKEFHP